MAIENFCFSLPNKLFASCFRARLNTVLWWFAVLYVLLLSSNKGQMCWSWFIAFPSSTLTPTMLQTHTHTNTLGSSTVLAARSTIKVGVCFLHLVWSSDNVIYATHPKLPSLWLAGWLTDGIRALGFYASFVAGFIICIREKNFTQEQQQQQNP